MGHKNGLDGVYLTPTKNELFEEFQKAIVDLTISNELRLNAENMRLSKKQSDSEVKTIKIEAMEETQEKLLRRIERLERGNSTQGGETP